MSKKVQKNLKMYLMCYSSHIVVETVLCKIKMVDGTQLLLEVNICTCMLKNQENRWIPMNDDAQ